MPFARRITRFGFVNGYLVEEPDGLTLIDTMVSGSAPRIRTAAAALGRPIVRILLTHAHGDHAGSLDAVHADWPEAEVCISAVTRGCSAAISGRSRASPRTRASAARCRERARSRHGCSWTVTGSAPSR